MLISHLTISKIKADTGLTTLSYLESIIMRSGTVNLKTTKMTTITMIDLNRKIIE